MPYSIDTTLTEEQMAAYLDGMLSPEEATMVEDAIAGDERLQNIQEAIDDVDETYLVDNYDVEIPEECFADDFELPAIPGAQHDMEHINLFDDDDIDGDADELDIDGDAASGDGVAFDAEGAGSADLPGEVDPYSLDTDYLGMGYGGIAEMPLNTDYDDFDMQ